MAIARSNQISALRLVALSSLVGALAIAFACKPRRQEASYSLTAGDEALDEYFSLRESWAAQLGIKLGDDVTVQAVKCASLGHALGFQPGGGGAGDRVIAVNGTAVATVGEFEATVTEVLTNAPGNLEFTVARGDGSSATLACSPEQECNPFSMTGEIALPEVPIACHP